MRYIFVFVLMVAVSAYAQDLTELERTITSKKGKCAELAYADTNRYIQTSRELRAAGKYDLADINMERAFDAFKAGNARYLEMSGESNILRGRLMNVKTAVIDENPAVRQAMVPKIRRAEFKLDLCELVESKLIINELEKNIK